jgi:hypothetical protein
MKGEDLHHEEILELDQEGDVQRPSLRLPTNQLFHRPPTSPTRQTAYMLLSESPEFAQVCRLNFEFAPKWLKLR